MPLHIFRSGPHADMHGARLPFTPADFAQADRQRLALHQQATATQRRAGGDSSLRETY